MSFVLSLVLAASTAHDVAAFVTPNGIDFLEKQVPSYVPPSLSMPTLELVVAECSDAHDFIWRQLETEVGLGLSDFSLSIPDKDTLRVDLGLYVNADGIAEMQPCAGSLVCTDHLAVALARVRVDLGLTIDDDGVPRVALRAFDFVVDDDDVSLWLAGCSIDTVANYAIDYAKATMLDALREKLRAAVESQLAPELEKQLGAFTSLDGQVDFARLSARAEKLSLSNDGLAMAGTLDFTPAFQAVPGLVDTGEPLPLVGSAPDLSHLPGVDMGFSLNLSAVNDVLYHMWRRGYFRLTEAHLAGLGVPLELGPLASQLPGFPTGSIFHLYVDFGQPVRLAGIPGDVAGLSLALRDVKMTITGVAPDVTPPPIVITLDATAQAKVRLDGLANGLVAHVEAVSIDRLAIDDGGLGLDASRMSAVLSERLLTPMLAQLGDLPLTGAVLGVAGYHVLPRAIATSTSHIAAAAQLYRAPAHDVTPPDTTVVQMPSGIARPADALLVVSGSDDLVPAELLRYAVTVDGVSRTPDGLAAIKVGAPGVTATYHIIVQAMDLAGNTDATPVVRDLRVDGIPPKVSVLGAGVVDASSGSGVLRIVTRDDTSSSRTLFGKVYVYRFTDPSLVASATFVDEVSLAAGQTETELSFATPGVYEARVDINDEAGNVGSTSVVFDASAAKGCAGAPASALAAVLACIAVLGRRTRKL